MSRSRVAGGRSGSSEIEGALEVLEAEDLRELIRDLLRDLEADSRARVIDRLVAHAAKKRTGWKPKGPDEHAVAEAIVFAKAAERDHYADTRAVDPFLRRATDAFLRKDYETAKRIFHALLPPMAVADIDLGQDCPSGYPQEFSKPGKLSTCGRRPITAHVGIGAVPCRAFV